MLIGLLSMGLELRAQEITLYLDSFYRIEFSNREDFENSMNKREVKKPTKWEHSEVRFAVDMDDSSIIFNKGLEEFPQKVEDAMYFKSLLRRSSCIQRFYYTNNPCGVRSLFLDIPAGKNRRILIYYHQLANLNFEAVYFPYDVKKMNALIRNMDLGE